MFDAVDESVGKITRRARDRVVEQQKKAVDAVMQEVADTQKRITQMGDATEEAARAEIESAEKLICDAQQGVSGLEAALQARLKEIEGELKTATQGIRKARRDVENAQQEVNRLNGVIREKEKKRDQLSRKQLCTTVWTPWSGNEEVCIPDPGALAQAAVLQGEIAALYVALGAGNAALEVVKAVLTAAEEAVKGITNLLRSAQKEANAEAAKLADARNSILNLERSVGKLKTAVKRRARAVEKGQGLIPQDFSKDLPPQAARSLRNLSL